MTVFVHAIPGNIVGVSPPVIPTQGAYLVHDVERSIYAQVSASPALATKVGFIPATSDGFGGITQLARDFDCRNNPQTQTGFTANLSGTTLSINYPALSLMWDGIMRPLAVGIATATVSTGLWSLVVGYNYGLTLISIVQTSTLDPTANYLELCEVNVNTSASTAVVSNGMTGLRVMQKLCVATPAAQSYGVPVSGSNGAMPW